MKKLSLVLISMVVMILLACSGGGSNSSGGSSSSGSNDSDPRDTLNNDPIHEIVPRDEQFRPMKKKRFVPFLKQIEYFQIGSSYNNDTENNLFIIDPDVSPGQDDLLDEPILSAFFTTDYKKIAAYGMMDDDIQDEVAVVCFPNTGPGHLLIINPKGDPDNTEFEIDEANVTLDIDDKMDSIYDYDIAAGDIDGDGYDEIVIAGSSSDRVGRLWIVDDSKNDYMKIKTIDVQGPLDGLKVASGNIDQDWADEIAIAFAVLTEGSLTITEPNMSTTYITHSGPLNYAVFDDSQAEFEELKETTTQLEIMQINYPNPYFLESFSSVLENTYFNIAMGDMDKDGRDEIAIASLTDEVLKYWGPQLGVDVEVIDDIVGADGDKADFDDAFIVMGSHFHTENIDVAGGAYPLLRKSRLEFFDTVDIDGDRADEIFLCDRILDDVRSDNGNSLAPVSGNYEGFAPIVSHDFVYSVSFGDVNGDFREDITILYPDSIIETIGYEEEEIDEDTVKLHWRGGRHFINQSTGQGYIDQRGTSTNFDMRDLLLHKAKSMLIFSANVDNDSIFVEYEADNLDATPIEIEEAHTTHYSQNHILAVLAAPPAIDGINTDGSFTSFGVSATTGQATGTDFTATAGILVGVEAGDENILKFEGEVHRQIEATLSEKFSTSVTRTIKYYTGDKEDRVIFTTTPYDRYQYKIASHHAENMVGKGFFIDFPQEPRTLSWRRKFYNENNGDQLDVGSEILQHKPGYINTYPTKDKMETIVPDEINSSIDGFLIDHENWWLEVTNTSLGQSNYSDRPHPGSTQCDYEEEISSDWEAAAGLTLSTDVMGKACGGTVCGGLTGGFAEGDFSEITIGQSTLIGYNVSPIPEDIYLENVYDFGMFYYRQTLTDDETNITHDFVVVNYWVE